MTQIERDIRTEELIQRSRRLREQLTSMVTELDGFVHELDSFIALPPEEYYARRARRTGQSTGG